MFLPSPQHWNKNRSRCALFIVNVTVGLYEQHHIWWWDSRLLWDRSWRFRGSEYILFLFKWFYLYRVVWMLSHLVMKHRPTVRRFVVVPELWVIDVIRVSVALHSTPLTFTEKQSSPGKLYIPRFNFWLSWFESYILRNWCVQILDLVHTYILDISKNTEHIKFKEQYTS